MSEVRLLNVCRSLNLDQGVVFMDPFDGVALSGTNWPGPAPTWTLDGTASTGFPLVLNGLAFSNVANVLRAAVLNDRTISTASFREVSIGTPTIIEGARYSLLMDMNNSTPVPAASIRLRATASTSNLRLLRLFVNEILVASFNSFGTAAPHDVLRLSIKSNGAILCYWESPTTPSIAFGPTGYMPAGGRVGFALHCVGVTTALASYFNHSYTVLAAATMPPRALIASANGRVYWENVNGAMVELVTPVRTLASDRLLSSANRKQKLYIADYGLRKQGTAGFTNGDPGTTFDDGTVADWTTLGIDPDDDRLEILSGTGLPTGVVGQGIGIYAISSVSAGSVTLASTPGFSATAITYRIVRGPKVFDAPTLTLTAFPIGTIGQSPGQAPVGCTIVALWADRLIWTGDPMFPHVMYLSKNGDPENYFYANRTEGEAFVFDPAKFAGAGQIGDAVTAVIPYSDDYLLIGGDRSLSIQRGDPTLGGVPDLVTRTTGILDKFAWCQLPDGRILVLGNDGLYLPTTAPNTPPERVSRDRLPQELIDINPALYDVQLQYDLARQGVKIFITPKTAGPSKHWWFDWTKKAFWIESLPSNVEPTASTVHSIGGSGISEIILGGRDGYLRREVDTQSLDDGNAVASFALLGPFNLGHPKNEGIIHEVTCEPVSGSVPVLVEVLVGNSPAEARSGVAADSYTFDVGNFITWRPRLRGAACFLRVSGGGNLRWATETLTFDREIVGRLRAS
jgi:hypothetical protein